MLHVVLFVFAGKQFQIKVKVRHKILKRNYQSALLGKYVYLYICGCVCVMTVYI